MNGNGGTFRRSRGFPPLLDPETLPRGPVLAFAPHPDDEIIGCGGALARHRERGDPVVVVHLTGGEGGDPQGFEGTDLVAVRARESREALAGLGVDPPVALGFPDGGLEPTEEVVLALAAEIDKAAPVIVYAPSPLECHPDHLAACWAVCRALQRTPLLVRLLCYEVNHPTVASWLLDVTPWIDRKRRALEQFQSQQRYQDLVGKCLAAAYARTVNVDLPEVQYAEAFLELDPARLEEVWQALETVSRAAAGEGPA